MRSIVSNATKLSLAGLALCLTMNSSYANTLSEVEITGQEYGYGIILKAEEATQLKKTVYSNDRMSLELKDINVSEEFNTVYNNVANLDNVTITPVSKNNVKITFKGENVAESKISFATSNSVFVPPTQVKETIQLSAPVSSYTPVYSPESFVEEVEESQTSNPQLNEVLTKMHITKSMLVTAKRYTKVAINKIQSSSNNDMNMLTLMGIGIIIAAFLLKPRRKEVSAPQKSIGLTSRENLEREINLNKNMANNMNLNRNQNPGLGYGMKAYQQSQRNPYMTTNVSSGVSGIASRKSLSNSAPIKRQTLNAQPITRESAPIKTTPINIPVASKMPQLKQTQKPTSSIQAANNSILKAKTKLAEPVADLDSVKFLESITKIYEKSGRTDLAKGLKENLRKAQLTQV